MRDGFKDSPIKKFTVVIVPHWKTGGGAGLYIQQLIKSFETLFHVEVSGVYACTYRVNSYPSSLFGLLSRLVYPSYRGVSGTAKAFWLLHSICLLIRNFFSIWVGSSLKKIDCVVFTSSVQMPSVLLLRWLCPNIKIILVVQEQLTFGSEQKSSSLKCLKLCDAVVSITDDWSVYARSFGLKVLTIKNLNYDLYLATSCSLDSLTVNSDLLYVGGGLKLKGFDFMMRVIPHLVDNLNLSICLLGNFRDTEAKMVRDLMTKLENKANIKLIGAVDDIRPYLCGTKLLVLPILSPHFCRPALEAGFCGRPFIIPSFPELREFAFHNVNCLTYDYQDYCQFSETIRNSIRDSSLLRKLGSNNYDFSHRYQDEGKRQSDASLRNILSIISICADLGSRRPTIRQ